MAQGRRMGTGPAGTAERRSAAALAQSPLYAEETGIDRGGRPTRPRPQRKGAGPITTGLPVLDATVQETNVWLKLTMDRLHTDDRHATYLALRAALHALRDRLGPEHATHLGVHLPLLLRGVCYEGWRMAATPTCERSPAEFVADVRHELPPDTGIDANLASRASLAVPWEKLDSGEVAKMQRILPQELQSLWPPPWRAAAGRAPERSGSPGRPQARSLSPVAPSFCAQWAQQ